MTPALARQSGPIYRVGRRPDAWAWPDWNYAPFGNRFDDPLAEYRVLYASERRAGAFAETLARFRPDPELVAALREIEGEGEALAPGVVPREWLEVRAIGTAEHGGVFVDLGHSETLAHLRSALAARLVHYGLDDLDAGDIRRRTPRAFTQELSRHVFVTVRDRDGQPVAGIRYGSRLGDEHVNWAIFETEPPADTSSRPIEPDDPDLLAVFDLFGLTWG
jgi:hypothetical protein